MRSTKQPSKFWEQLGDAHRRDLSEYGFEVVKRHQALRYFTWRWQWSSIRKSEQMRFLLKHTPLPFLLRCATTPTPLSDDAWAGVAWKRRDRWLYVFATRLLWRYAERHDTTGTTALPEPLLGAPLPVPWRGRLISQDLGNSSLELAAIHRALQGRRPTSILEIGAGYGRSAYALMNCYPEATYTIVDIEPAIEISRWYLAELFPSERLRFLQPEEIAELAPGSFDLAVSISSLQEMTPKQVDEYLRALDRVARGGTVYLKQWISWRNPVDEIELKFDDYPIPAGWASVFHERAPVQTNFAQAAWAIPSPDESTGS
jgi:putative sugar O-methyltransferase